LQREYHRWWSKDLSRDMELLVFGHAGTRVLVFPTSMGRFFEYENTGMVANLSDRIEGGQLQLFCVDSVDGESWYNKQAHPYWRVQRHMQYERYLVNEVLPMMERKNQTPRLIATGCSFGGYHAANLGFRHGKRTSASPLSCATRASATNSASGVTAVSTTGPGGNPWPGCTWSRGRTAGPSTALPRIPVKVGGAGKLHAVFLNEDRTRGSV
jgi:esterase/lipase superfamily enzyme